jgi:hypothetical protein
MPRTRVDQPFRVNIDIDGLLKGTDVPAAAGQVLLNHAGGNYPENTHSFKGSTEYYVDLASATIDKNGALALDYAFTNLSGADLTKVEGEEIWSIHALNGGENGETLVEGEILESATLQVWPIAEATITGIEAGESYGEVPAITVTLSDLYPDSTTFLRISEAATNGNSGDHTDVQSSYVIIKDSIPQQRTLTLDGLDDYFPNAGTYSLEVLHTTPFGTEVLARVHPITIDRVISIRGSINSSD